MRRPRTNQQTTKPVRSKHSPIGHPDITQLGKLLVDAVTREKPTPRSKKRAG